MDDASDLINDSEKLSQTFEYSLILENKYVALKKKLKNYKKDLNSAKSDNLDKDAVIASKVDEINLLESELEDYKGRCDDLVSDLSDYEKVKEDLVSVKSDNLDKDAVIVSKVDEINFLEEKLKNYKSQCRDLNIIIEEKNKHINELDSNVCALKEEIHYLKSNSIKIKLKNVFK